MSRGLLSNSLGRVCRSSPIPPLTPRGAGRGWGGTARYSKSTCSLSLRRCRTVPPFLPSSTFAIATRTSGLPHTTSPPTSPTPPLLTSSIFSSLSTLRLSFLSFGNVCFGNVLYLFGSSHYFVHPHFFQAVACLDLFILIVYLCSYLDSSMFSPLLSLLPSPCDHGSDASLILQLSHSPMPRAA